MSDLISVIVPIYNVERWLTSCIENILNQPFNNIELILVNDGSTDNCRAICEQYAQKDKKIKVVHKENGGLSSARNAGIEMATGKYIVFIDPDDQITEDYFISLFAMAEENNCDAIVSGYKTVPNNNNIIPGYQLNKVMEGKAFVLSSSNIHSNNDLCFVWRYIYKLSIIKENNIRFNEKVFIGEDVIFNLEFLLESKRVYAISKTLYFYTVNNPDSLMRVPYKPKLESSLILQYKIRKQLSKKFDLLRYSHYSKDLANYYINNIYRMIINNLKNSQSKNINDELRRLVNYEMFSDSLKEIGFSYKCNSIKEYIYYLALKFKVYPLLTGVYKRESR
ncbi:glycosyltransferase [Bacillus sp. V3B]|uniref:glycosyltransferase n=1 Tax=Bacillus sp. V3B TaxID=2804915 RepID=UPI00210C8D6A|nr:glycosyltransferase [Bacillus sp. V3B]MCQ6275296.1 glycosyltransferase [Bacillus sp. V3B]